MNVETTRTVVGEEIIPDYVCKIEGHGTLNIKFEECKAPLRILEGERLFEGFMLGREHRDVPFISSRICGICPTVHCLTSICALEKAMDITPSPETEMLRKLLLAGQIVQSHTLHIFFLALPDYLNVESALQIAAKYPDEFHTAIDLKRFADNMITVIGGRAVHPVAPQVSGFDRIVSREQLGALLKDAESIIDEAETTARLFGELTYPLLERPTQCLAGSSKDGYCIYNAPEIASSLGRGFKTMDYDKNIHETVNQFSTAKFSRKENQSFMVGAQARLNIGKEHLNPRSKAIVEGMSIPFPSDNSFHNNLAQAVENLHFMEEIVSLLNSLLEVDLENARSFDYEIKAGYGVGACEAPRGTLYHAYRVDEKGLVAGCDIITPTAQNLSNMEDDACKLLEETKELPEERRQHLLEVLIRAYDPCITCSVH